MKRRGFFKTLAAGALALAGLGKKTEAKETVSGCLEWEDLDTGGASISHFILYAPDGPIAQARVYDRELTPEEAEEMARSPYDLIEPLDLSKTV